jgi:hypothetical protein
MFNLWWILLLLGSVAGGVVVVVLGAAALRRLVEQRNKTRLAKAKSLFHLRREWLEAEFLTVASRSGKPRGLEWADCDFQDQVSFARERQTGDLCALVGVAISFQAVEGGGMEDNPNVEYGKAGSAVFRFDGRHWSTDGRALLNLDPNEAIARLRNELETVD